MKLNTWKLLVAAASIAAFCNFSADRIAAQTAAQRSTSSDSASAPARIIQTVDDTQRVKLKDSVHPLARAEFDQGSVSDAQIVKRMMLLLKRSDDQETALQQLLEEQQNKDSANFHAWLTPEQFGKKFGPADADIQTVTSWLTSQGFTEIKVGPGRSIMEFTGNVGQVRNAFHTEIHGYLVKGESHQANSIDPQIPKALAPVVGGIVSLHNFPKKSYAHRLGTFQRTIATGEVRPLFTYTDLNGTFYGVGPSDFATIYDVAPLWTAGIDGTGQTIAIVGETNINAQDVIDFRNLFGLPANFTAANNIILNGPDPGIVSKGAEGEADLDVQWSGAVAKNATIKLVVSETTESSAGIDLSALYIIDNNIAPVMSVSFGDCEKNLGTNGNAFYTALWEQAAAQGITVMVSTGDNGAAGCDDFNTATSATHGLAVSGIASTPFNVAVGGTDFDQAGNQTKYWKPVTGNNATTQASVLSYIPEITWNDSCADAGLAGCTSATGSSLNIVAGSGGASAAHLQKPTWQSGPGVPPDGVRDLPDVSLFASDGFNKSFYIVCQSDANASGHPDCNLTTSATSGTHDFEAVGGTSASSPAFAGIMALVNQKTGARQGNANYVLYALAGKPAAQAFHDITKGNISVPCAMASLNCSPTPSGGKGVLVTPSNSSTVAWNTTAGYDLATGLGSVDATNLVNNWTTVSFVGTTTTLSLSPLTFTKGTAVTVNITVTPGTATGDVALLAATGTPAGGMGVFTLDNTGKVTNQTTTLLPGGMYAVKAHYAGDGTRGASDSNAVTVTVNPGSSKVIPTLVTTACQASGISVAYGSPYVFRVDVVSGSAPNTLCSDVVTESIPTGQVTVTKTVSGTTSTLDLSPFTLNALGYFEDQPIQLPPGSYVIASTYSGDRSYKPSSADFSLTITKAATTTTVAPVTGTVTAGSSVALTANVTSSSNSNLGPSGTVQFMLGSTTLGAPVKCMPAGATAQAGASCTAMTNAALSMLLPPGGTQRIPGPPSPLLWLLVAMAMVLAYLATRMTTPRQRRYAYAAAMFLIASAIGVAGCGGGNPGTPGGGGGTHNDSITAVYTGDANYAGSTSAAISVTVK